MTITQCTLTIIIGVTAILLARETHITSTDAGRLLLTATIMTLIVSMPEAMPVVDRLIAAIIGGYAMHCIIGMALGPVQYRVLRRQPIALLVASRSAYRMQFGARRMVAA